MFCSQCGTELAADSIFCSKCGKPIPTQSQIAAPSPVDSALSQARPLNSMKRYIIRARNGEERLWLASKTDCTKACADRMNPLTIAQCTWTTKTMLKAILMMLLVVLCCNVFTAMAAMSVAQCNQEASKTNESLPMMIDKITELKGSSCIQNERGVEYIYFYTLKMKKMSDIKYKQFIALARKQFIGVWCNSPKTKILLGLVDSIGVEYSNTDHERIGEFHITKQDCR
jgi:hypothetical protein